MPVGPGANSIWGNTLDRDMNTPNNNSNSNNSGINSFMNNPK
jgi:hypothetical protein